jgi:hypothetical protein
MEPPDDRRGEPSLTMGLRRRLWPGTPDRAMIGVIASGTFSGGCRFGAAPFD